MNLSDLPYDCLGVICEFLKDQVNFILVVSGILDSAAYYFKRAIYDEKRFNEIHLIDTIEYPLRLRFSEIVNIRKFTVDVSNEKLFNHIIELKCVTHLTITGIGGKNPSSYIELLSELFGDVLEYLEIKRGGSFTWSYSSYTLQISSLRDLRVLHIFKCQCVLTNSENFKLPLPLKDIDVKKMCSFNRAFRVLPNLRRLAAGLYSVDFTGIDRLEYYRYKDSGNGIADTIHSHILDFSEVEILDDCTDYELKCINCYRIVCDEIEINTIDRLLERNQTITEIEWNKLVGSGSTASIDDCCFELSGLFGSTIYKRYRRYIRRRRRPHGYASQIPLDWVFPLRPASHGNQKKSENLKKNVNQ